MTISLQVGVSTPTLPGIRSADAPVQKTTRIKADDTAFAPGQNDTSDNAAGDIEKRRFERIKEASSKFDLYPISDKTFTIYKTPSGEYITRYVSLRDGRVTYYPEPTVLASQPIEVPATSKFGSRAVVALQV